MGNATNDAATVWTPPYIPWARIPKLIEQLGTDRPARIDRTVLTGSNQVRYQTLKALASLELIDSDGFLTEMFNRLIDAPEDRTVVVRGILERFYPEAVQLGKQNGTQLQLEEAFRKYGVSGSTSRKAIAFFLKAAEYAELPMSPHFRAPPIPRKTSPKKAPPSSPALGNDPPTASDAESATGITSLKARYVEMLMKKVDSQDDLDDNLLDRIERLLDFRSEDKAE